MTSFYRHLSYLQVGLIALLSLFLAQCSLENSTNLFDDAANSFTGASSVVPQGDGTWALSWNPVNGEGRPLYRVYQRGVAAQYDFTAPLTTTTQLSYVTDNLTGKEALCFMVRAIPDGVTEGAQTPERCTDASKNGAGFDGLRSLSQNKNASLTLLWSKINSDQLYYGIYVRNAKDAWDLKAPTWTTREATFKVPASPFGESYCYLVRYTGTGVIADQNTKEICTAKEDLGEFSGIASAASPGEGNIEIKWSPSSNANVAGYRIYRDAKFTTLMTNIAKNETTYTVGSLTPGELVRLGVRVVDKMGREDANTKTIAVRVTCNSVCNNPPETPDPPSLQLIPPSSSGASAICTSTYKDVDPDGTPVRATFEFYNLKKPDVARARVAVDPGAKTAIYQLKTVQEVSSVTDADTRGDRIFCRVAVTDGIATVFSLPNPGSIVIENAAPVIKNSDTKSGAEGALLTFTLNTIDPDGDSITAACTSGCIGGASFSANTKEFSWTPNYGQAGTYQLVFTATDGLATTTQTIPVTIAHTNRVPVFTDATPKSVEKNSLLAFVLHADDPDGTAVTYSCKENCPTGIMVNSLTGSVQWTPTGLQLGTFRPVFSASDGEGEGTLSVTINVRNINNPPVFSATNNQTSDEMQTLSFSVSAIDPDGDVVAYRCASSCPAGLTIHSLTGVVQWLPSSDQSGTYNVTLEATDGQKVATNVVTITVVNVNRPPLAVASLSAPNPAYNDNTLGCSSLGTSDPDIEDIANLNISYKWYADNLVIPGATTTQFVMNGLGGIYNGAAIGCEVIVTDGKVSSPITARSTAVTIQNRAPTARALISPPNPILTSTLTCDVSTSTDPDGDLLSYTYVWRKNGTAISGQNSSTLPSSQLVNQSDFSCTAIANDGHGGLSSATSTAVTMSNQAPILSAISSQTTNENVTLSFNLSATDPDGDQVGYSCSANCPTGLTVNTSTGAVSWPVDYGQYGNYSVTFRATDGSLASTQVASITVNKVNRPPVPVAILIAPTTLYNNGTLGCSSAGTADPDAEDAAYVASHITYKWLANGAYIPGETNSALVLPGAVGMYVGQTITCEVSATDGHTAQPVAAVSTEKVVSNRAPTVSVTLSPVTPTQADTLTCGTTGSSDPDGDSLNFGYVWKKDNVVIDGETSSTLSSAQLVHFSTYLCEATADDSHGGVTTAGATPVTVQNRNPVVSIVTGNSTTQDVAAGAAITNVTLAGSDPDGDSITFERTPGSTDCPNIVIDANTGVISGRVQRMDETPVRAAQCNPKFRTKDASNAYSSDVTLTIYSINRSPTVSCNHQTGNYGDTVVAGSCTFADPDAGTTKTYGLASNGCGLGINLSGMLTGTIPANTCTSTVTVSDGVLTANATITLTPIISLAVNGASAILDDQCFLTLPGSATYASDSYSSATATLSNGTVSSANGTGIIGTITNPLLGNFNLSWIVNGSSSSTTLNQTLSLVGSSIAGTVLKQMIPNATIATNAYAGLEAPKQGCGSYCNGTRGQIMASSSETSGTLCALTAGGGVSCWGQNSTQQTGVGSYRATPALIPGITTALKTAMTSSTYLAVCMLLSDGTVKCLGSNGYGLLADGSTTSGSSSTPVAASGISGATDLAAGDAFYCALLGTTVKCWGDNSYYQIGTSTAGPFPTPQTVLGLPNVTMLAAGGISACAANSSGIWCWGHNGSSQLGNGTTANSYTPIQVLDSNNVALSNITSIGISSINGCASTSSGNAYCWGTNYVGNGTASNTTKKAVQVLTAASSPLTNVTRILSMSSNLACAQTSDNKIWCWGSLGSGYWKGDGVAAAQPLYATQLTALSNGTTASAWALSNTGIYCAIRSSDAALLCWGVNGDGLLGNGTFVSPNNTPTAVTDLPAVSNVSTGPYNVCAVASGSVYCWGRADSGQLGYPTTTVTTPMTISGLSGVAQLAYDDSSNTTYAMMNDGSLKKWGGSGNRGANLPQAVSIPGEQMVAFAPLKGASSSFCYLNSSGTVKCWGTGSNGVLGNGDIANSPTTPVTANLGLTGEQKAVALASSYGSFCAVISPGGSVKCWGSNVYGETGPAVNSPAYQSTPQTISELNNVVSLAGSYKGFCALISNGTVKCWGINTEWELNNGTTTPSATPVAISGISNAVAISGNGAIYNSWYCAVMNDRSAKCWGYNGYSLGDSTIPTISSPVTTILNAFDGVVAIGGIGRNICILTGAGQVKCWGYNGFGNSGIGHTNAVPGYPLTPALLTPAVWTGCNKLSVGP